MTGLSRLISRSAAQLPSLCRFYALVPTRNRKQWPLRNTPLVLHFLLIAAASKSHCLSINICHHVFQLEDEPTIQYVAATTAGAHEEEGGGPRCIYALGESTPHCFRLISQQSTNMMRRATKKSQDASATSVFHSAPRISRTQNRNTSRWSLNT
jgi:hypothetical protein